VKDERSRVLTIEQARAELQRIMAEFFAEVAKEINGGKSYEVAMMDVCKARPDLIDRENHLRDHIKGLGRAEQSVGIAELRASVAAGSGDVASEIETLAEQKLAASEGRMDYGAALKAVLGERPDLERRYKDEIRRDWV
jgi:hypothetical protein